jgi:hypothetical protein
MKKTYHVTSDTEGRWVVRRSGSERAQKAFDTKKDAIDFAKEHATRISQKDAVEVYIHRRDGQISQKDSYGADPKPPKQKR